MAEQPSKGSGKSHNGWRKNPPLLAEILALAEKFRAMVCDNFPGKFRRRQVVVMRHTLSGLELCGILFAVQHDMGQNVTVSDSAGRSVTVSNWGVAQTSRH
jgi:hypothetical protein